MRQKETKKCFSAGLLIHFENVRRMSRTHPPLTVPKPSLRSQHSNSLRTVFCAVRLRSVLVTCSRALSASFFLMGNPSGRGFGQ